MYNYVLSPPFDTILFFINYGNRKRHHTPLGKKYRLIELLCIGRKHWERLKDKELVDSHKRSYNKINQELPEKKAEIINHTCEEENLRVIMSNWYHGQFSRIKTGNYRVDQLWGDLTVEQEMRLKRILKGEF